jgi:tripartite-type tricarboxylate transporter receptor subunit TctC
MWKPESHTPSSGAEAAARAGSAGHDPGAPGCPGQRLGRWLRAAFTAFLLAPVPAMAAEDELAEFYSGKVLHFIVGYAPGGGYDLYTRVIAAHIGRFLPGNPSTMVENRPGANSMIAANQLYRTAARDGLVIGTFNGFLSLDHAIGDESVTFDPRSFGWIGAPSRSYPACFMMGFTGVETLDALVNSGREFRFAGSRDGSFAYADILPRFLNAVLSTRLRVVPGYRGTSHMLVALQQREVDGMCTSFEGRTSNSEHLLSAPGEGRLNLLALDPGHPETHDRFSAIPSLRDAVSSGGWGEVYDYWSIPLGFSRPLAVPPGTPVERLHALRRAFEQTLRDPLFLADAEAAGLIIETVTGAEIETLIHSLYSAPEAVRARLRELARTKGG